MTTTSRILTSSLPLDAPLPTLQFELISEILCRLPVKLLLQLKCVSKSWKSIISDPKFAKKHLHMSTTCHHHHHLLVTSTNTSNDSLLWNSPISSLFSDTSSTSTVLQLQLNELMYPDTPLNNGVSCCAISSCDGILLFDVDLHSPLLWNPSTRKFKILPPLLNQQQRAYDTRYTFGYDRFIDNYKVFAVSFSTNKAEVSIYTLGIHSWRRTDDFPYDGLIGLIDGPGMFVSGNVNWLAIFHGVDWVIVSFDLEKETCRKRSTPDVDIRGCTLGVLRDCLCIFTDIYDRYCGLWVMKEYGIEESWTKLFSISTIPNLGRHISHAYNKVLYVLEDGRILLNLKKKMDLVVFNPRKSPSTFKRPKIENIEGLMVSVVFVESLISPSLPGRERVPLWRERHPRHYLFWLPVASIIFSLILVYLLSYHSYF